MSQRLYLVHCQGKFENRAVGKRAVSEGLNGIELEHVPDSSRLTADYYEACFLCNREITQDEIKTARENEIEISPVKTEDLLKRNGGVGL